MRHSLLSSVSMAPFPSPSFSSSQLSLSKPKRSSSWNSNSAPPCSSSSSSLLDILILILVLFSGGYLVLSYFSYIRHSLFLLLGDSPVVYFIGFLLLFLIYVFFFDICRGKKCENPHCRGLKKAFQFDLKVQTEECLRSYSPEVREIDELPWKGGEGNPDYECLRVELRKVAPPNGRAALLFLAKCGCPVAKLEGWGVKRGRRNKKNPTIDGMINTDGL
ncbi:hypothetical protein NMG60_11029844 [Bertholletia excelsa]